MNDSAAATESLIKPELRQRIEGIETLPTLPETYTQLVSELSSDDVSMKRVAAIVSQDVAISAKLLQVVNSAYFAVANRIQSVQQAVSHLGVETVKGVVLSAGVYSGKQYAEISGFSPAELYRRAVSVGPKARFIAYSLGLPKSMIDTALTAGLLHDVGKLVLLAGFADEFEAACSTSKAEKVPLHTAIEQELGADDAAIGGTLLASWGLTEPVVHAVALHYEPSKGARPELDATAAVHLAYASESNPRERQVDPEQMAFDVAYTDALGITGQLTQIVDLSAEAIEHK